MTTLAKTARACRAAAPAIARDLAGLIGFGTLLHGVAAISPPAAEILGGGIVVAATLLIARRG